ncbi:hypothetical protein GQ457_18G011530 [Hibiscus cannabinus]
MTNWTKGNGIFPNNDCNTWENDLDTLCFDCKSCKVGFISPKDFLEESNGYQHCILRLPNPCLFCWLHCF